MTEQGRAARAVWDPTANNGAGGWVRRPVADDPAAAGPPTTAIPLPKIPAGPVGPAAPVTPVAPVAPVSPIVPQLPQPEAPRVAAATGPATPPRAPKPAPAPPDPQPWYSGPQTSGGQQLPPQPPQGHSLGEQQVPAQPPQGQSFGGQPVPAQPPQGQSLGEQQAPAQPPHGQSLGGQQAPAQPPHGQSFGGQQQFDQQPYGQQQFGAPPPPQGGQPGFGGPQQTFGGQQFPPQPPQGQSFGGQQQFDQQPYGQPPFEQQPYGQQQFGQPQFGGPPPSYGGQQTFGGQQFPNGPGGYGGQESEFDYEDDPRRRRTPVLIGAAVALLVVIGVGVVWAVQNSDSGTSSQSKGGNSVPAPDKSQSVPGGGASPVPSASSSAGPSASGAPSAGPDAAAEAKALDALLTKGENAKAPIGNAVAKVRSCPPKTEIDNAAKVFDAGAQQRDQLLAELAQLHTDNLPGGADAAAKLKDAWQASGDIDRAYAAWARAVSAQGCANNTAPSTADLGRANDLNPQATQSKKDFVTKWKPIADTYGLTVRTWDRI
ncbi:hypothetical protein [Kitasatospora griseola]|uniref:hypothetical protein n=1 Tax=Kitasatospora griseola TaxID=2064 RepID=UPI00382E8AD4